MFGFAIQEFKEEITTSVSLGLYREKAMKRMAHFVDEHNLKPSEFQFSAHVEEDTVFPAKFFIISLIYSR